jgi:hypothetical protein
MHEIALDIQGLGIILYSPSAVAHIPEGADYLQSRFWHPDDVAQHVMECRLTAFGTGSSGSFQLRFFNGPPNDELVQASRFKLRLGLKVDGGCICVRDLYDLMEWTTACPVDQQFEVPNGWYRLTVFSSPPPSGIIGDKQDVGIFLEVVDGKPQLRWEGVPSLC